MPPTVCEVVVTYHAAVCADASRRARNAGSASGRTCGRPMSLGCYAGLPCRHHLTRRDHRDGESDLDPVHLGRWCRRDRPDWHFPYFDENMGRAVGEDYATADVLLLGRVTYDSFAGAWPGRETAGEADAQMASPARRHPQDRRLPAASRVHLAEVRAAPGRAAPSGRGAQGSARHPRHPHPRLDLRGPAAARRGLVDELRLLVHPVAARKGRRLFDDGDAPYHLRFSATEVFPTGVIRVIYSPAAAPASRGLRGRQGPGARREIAALRGGSPQRRHIRRPAM